MSLQVTSLSDLQERGQIGVTSVFLLNKRRKQVRKDRILSLQKSVTQSFTDRSRFKQSSQPNYKKLNSNLHYEQGYRPLSFQSKTNDSKGVRKGFLNTFMRDGKRLRYQNILRKALLTIKSDKQILL